MSLRSEFQNLRNAGVLALCVGFATAANGEAHNNNFNADLQANATAHVMDAPDNNGGVA